MLLKHFPHNDVLESVSVKKPKHITSQRTEGFQILVHLEIQILEKTSEITEKWISHTNVI